MIDRSPMSIALATLALALAGCNKAEAPPQVIRPVLTQQVAMESTAAQSVYAGEVRARNEVDLSFRVPGKIVSRKVDVGATVKKGTLLATIDPADLRLALEAASSQVLAAQTEHDFAQAELQRFKNLLDKSFISQSAYDGKLAAYNAARARLAQARAQANVSRNQSGYASLVAPDNGIITTAAGEIGQVVTAGQPVFRLSQPDELEVVVSVPESRIDQLKQADEVTMRLWAQQEKLYKGKVREIAPNADAATRTFTVKVAIPDADADVRIGMTANLVLDSAATDAALVPLSAIYSRDGKAHVWVLDKAGSKVNLRPVDVSQYRENGALVKAGLKAGETIVTAGVQKLTEGQAVRAMANGG